MMEAAIRWSPHSTRDRPHFLIIDVAGNQLKLCQIDEISGSKVEYQPICIRDKLPNYTAFDWSRKEPGIVAIGSASGEATVVTLDPDRPNNDDIHSFSIRHQRKCNSIAFSSKNLLATGLDRVRNDVCLNIYDLNDSHCMTKDEPFKKLASSETVSSIKFFAGQPDTLIAGVSRQHVRMYDLRDSSTSNVAQLHTRQVHNIAIDPLDENYFLSAGTASDSTVTVWDTRFVKQRGASNDLTQNGAVLEFKSIIDKSHSAAIWSLRYCGTKRGVFGVLANTGEFKVVEIAQHFHQSSQAADTANARAWNSPYYTKVSHQLCYPSFDKLHKKDDKGQVIAYDFVTAGNPLDEQYALTLHANREIAVLRIPSLAPRLNISALGEIYKDKSCVAAPTLNCGTVAEDLAAIQSNALSEKHKRGKYDRRHISMSTNDSSLEESRQNFRLSSATQPSHQLHKDILNLAYPDVKIPIADYLAVMQTSKRRVHEGYSLNCAQNKAIVMNDPWLVDAWTFVDRMDRHASNDGMVGNGLDLKYLGVHSIWSNELTMYDERLIDPDTKTSQDMFSDAVKEIVETMEYPVFDGVRTDYPENRQLCLSLCGWSLSKAEVQRSCQALADEGQIYKGIVLAVFQDSKDVALAILRSTLQQKKLPQDDIGLAAMIACASPSSGVSNDHREACSWMADMTSDPYLRSLLTFFVSGEWITIVNMKQLSLNDRVAVALKYLPDPQLSDFLNTTTSEAIKEGDTSGLLLTGLTTRSLDLLQAYIAKHPAGIQDAVLILSRACPLYIQDPRWNLWKDIYLSSMQTWRAFLERTRYIKEHNQLSVTREGRSVNKPSQPSLTIRCLNCQQNLALRRDSRSSKHRLLPALKPNASSRPLHNHKYGTSSPALSCPSCGAPMPRCGLCMLWLGCPDPSKQGAHESLQAEELDTRFMVFCMNCTHGFHGHHARDWFAKHTMCPVPDCSCMCGLLK